MMYITEEVITELEKEQQQTARPVEWHTIESPYNPAAVNWTPQLHDAVMFGDTPCPYCNGHKKFEAIQQWGNTDQIRKMSYTCPCQEKMPWKRKVLERVLPARYHHSNLFTLAPSSLSKMSAGRQEKILEFLKGNRNKTGFFLFGPPGTSKTTFATALIRNAIERDWNKHFMHPDLGYLEWKASLWIRYVNWDDLICQYLEYQNHPDDAPRPSVTPRLIRESKAAGRTPVIAIEEVDKSRLTEYKANKLFELVHAIDETQGQLIMTTNHRSQSGFQKWLYGTDNPAINQAGEPVWRRISDNCQMIDCKAG